VEVCRVTTFKTIVIAVDFSEHARKALDMGIDLAKQFGASVHLVHAFELPMPILTPYEVALPDNFMGDARKAGRRELDALEKTAADAGLDVKSHLRDGPPDMAIDEVAKEVSADLIVIGTRGNTGLKHIVLGSVAERTLRHSPCPVLAVK
jgi:nucleotide-binding universal stress UspA family protein